MNLEATWYAYRSSLKLFLHSKVSNRDDVEDLLQEILIKTHNNIRELKKDESIRLWLFQIANRTVIDFYRKRGRISELASDQLWYGGTDCESDPRADLSRCIEPFLAELPDNLGDILRAVDLEGQSQKSYAHKMGLSYSTLKSRVQKGRSELRKLFESCCCYWLDKRGTVIDFEKKKAFCKEC